MAGKTIFRGPNGTGWQPRTVSKPVAGAYVPGTFVEETATQLSQITTASDKRPMILGNLDFKDQDISTAYTSGDTGVAYHLEPGMAFTAALAAATYTYNQPLTIAASGRLAAASSGNVIVAFFRDTPGAFTAGQLADVEIANFSAKA